MKRVMRTPLAVLATCTLTAGTLMIQAQSPDHYDSRPCKVRANPNLVSRLRAGDLSLIEGWITTEGGHNPMLLPRAIPLLGDWSTSVLKPEGLPPKADAKDIDSLIKYDLWSCKYSAYYVRDHDPATAWVEGVEGPGIGEALLVRVDTTKPVKIWAGLGTSADLFKANNRPSKIRVSILQPAAIGVAQQGIAYNKLRELGSAVIALKDFNGYQLLPLPKHEPAVVGLSGWSRGQTTILGIELLSVYPGTKYDDTAISEITN